MLCAYIYTIILKPETKKKNNNISLRVLKVKNIRIINRSVKFEQKKMSNVCTFFHDSCRYTKTKRVSKHRIETPES